MSTIVINLNPRSIACAVCGAECDHSHSVPMLEGLLVSNEWEGLWGGFEACRECYEMHARGELKTHDEELKHYLPQKRLVDWGTDED